MKKVSVIIPAYNAQKYLSETISSVINQTYQNLEIIIVDDGSTDKTKEIIHSFSDSRITYFYQSNSGVSTARNKGIEIATGDYFAFLDSDDVWLEDNIEEKVELLERSNKYDIAFSSIIFINGQSERGEIYNSVTKLDTKTLLSWQNNLITSPSILVCTRRVIDEIKGFDSELSTAADQDFLFRASSKFKLIKLQKETVLYRIHGENMHQNISLMEKDHILAFKKAEKYNLFESFWFKQKCFSNLYFILAGSWWVNGKNKLKGLRFLIKSIIIYPPTIFRILKKIL